MHSVLNIINRSACVWLFADAVPGAFTLLGIRNESAGSVSGLHTSTFQMDESQLPLGAALHASIGIEFLDQHARDIGQSSRKEEL